MRIGEIMGYISDFGTKYVAPISVWGIGALAAFSMSSALPASSGVDVGLNVSGLRNVKGQLMVCLTKNPKAFPDCSKDASAIKRLVPASDAANIRFSGIVPGTYAVAIVHDENRSNKMDLTFFIPKECFAFSRNPAIGMGPPKFKNAAFTVGAADASLSVKMKYMF
jgi:uncharacterized protein (DUF2141 family)